MKLTFVIVGAFATLKGLGEIATHGMGLITTDKRMGISATKLRGTIAMEVPAISHCVRVPRRGMSRGGLRRVPKKGGRELGFCRSARTCKARSRNGGCICR